MKNVILAFVLFSLYIPSLFAQSPYSIRGSIADTTAKTKLSNATIILLHSKDSILYNYTRTKPDGTFSMNDIPAGDFILWVRYTGYADYVERFSLSPGSAAKDFGEISLIQKARLLQEVVINGAVAITIKGDTTVFNASSYKVQPNARVEDLLKQMPGLQVDQNGQITAHGQTIGKVLVDGEEFFGSDPTLVTRNIRADMVKQIELFDKKSDQAILTKIDDGERTKTLNVVLKDDSKNGYFGKVDGGSGQSASTYYQGQAMYNNFTAKSKWSAYGVLSNTNKAGLGSADATKYSSIPGVSTDAQGLFTGPGLPITRNAGAHFDTKWNGNKETINLNYTVARTGNDAIVNTLSQNNLPGSTQYGISDLDRSIRDLNQRFNGTYVATLNPTSNLRVSASGTITDNDSREGYITTNTRGDDILLNQGNRTLTNDGRQQTFTMGASFSKRFKKAGRSLSLNLNQLITKNNSDRFLYSVNDFYNSSGAKDSTNIIDQYKLINNKNYATGANVTWSEPLFKTFSVFLNFGLNLANNSSNQESFNKSGSGKYDIRDNIYSSNYSVDQLSNNAGATFSYNKDKATLSFGTNISVVNYKQTDLATTKEYKRNFLNWSPQANYAYRFSAQKSLRMSYFGYTSQPPLEYIQPLRINTDPLNVTMGNTDLKPSFSHGVNFNYTTFKQLSGQSLSITAYGNLYSDRIVNKTFTDEAGKTTTQYVNLDKISDYFQFDVTLGNKLKKSGIAVNSNWNMTGQHNYNYVNNALNQIQIYTFNFYATFSKTEVKKYDFNIRTGPGYNLNFSSLQKDRKNSGWVYRIDPVVNVYLPGRVQINSATSYIYRQATKAFNEDYSAVIWNTTISKKFFKKENLTISLYGNDLLNQNKGIQRNSFYSNYFTQTHWNTIKRYYMLQLSWDFTKPAKAAPASQQAPVTR